MAYYRRRRFRSYRSRRWRNFRRSKYSALRILFGDAVSSIRQAFLNLDSEALDELLSDYGEIHGKSAESYARQAMPKWKSGETKLSGKTMERLIEIVPPYLSPEQRFSILQILLHRHKPTGTSQTIKINLKDPSEGFSQVDDCLMSMSHEAVLAHLPGNVMQAAKWLYVMI